MMEVKAMTLSVTGRLVLMTAFFYGMVTATNGDTMNDNQSTKWNDWTVVNDSVMGGISRSRPEVTDHDTLLFLGNVSLENNGGFASIRHVADSFDLGRGEGVLLRVKGDGKKYQFRLRTSDTFDDMAYKADFETVTGEWQEVRLPWNVFSATHHGEYVKDAPALNPLRIRQIGFLIADKQEGRFELEIGSIEAF